MLLGRIRLVVRPIFLFEPAVIMEKVIFKDLGLISYQEAWDYQTKIHKKLIEKKLEARKSKVKIQQKHHLIFCEHPPVYTLGKSGSDDNLLLDDPTLKKEGFEFYKINRGGDITYHGPGQLVVYPIFDLDCFFTDVHKYVRALEEVIIQMLDHYGLEAVRIKKYTGVWLPNPERKICAIGVHLSRWVTLHGLALNVKPTLSHFDNIIPCGITDADKAVTSMQKELPFEINMTEVKSKVKNLFREIFEFEFENFNKKTNNNA